MAFPTGWGRKQKITIDNTQVSGTGSHTDLPVLITLDHLDSEIVDAGANSALNGGGDIRFTSDSAGLNQLDIDIISFITSVTLASRACEIRVKLPVLSTSVDTDIWIWYKKAGETQPAGTATFGRDNTYSKLKRVFSLDENHLASAPQFIDRTGAGADGTANNTGFLSAVASGLNFDGSVDATQPNITSSPTGGIAAGAVVVHMRPSNVSKSAQYIIKSRTGQNADRLYLILNSGQITMRLSGSSAANF